jgi:hypothetical protein
MFSQFFFQYSFHSHLSTNFNIQAQTSHNPQPLGGGTTPLPIIYSMPFSGDYMQMSLFFKILKSESQNWDFMGLKTSDTHIFLKSNLL